MAVPHTTCFSSRTFVSLAHRVWVPEGFGAASVSSGAIKTTRKPPWKLNRCLFSYCLCPVNPHWLLSQRPYPGWSQQSNSAPTVCGITCVAMVKASLWQAWTFFFFLNVLHCGQGLQKSSCRKSSCGTADVPLNPSLIRDEARGLIRAD